jgi:hypothetical protein
MVTRTLETPRAMIKRNDYRKIYIFVIKETTTSLIYFMLVKQNDRKIINSDWTNHNLI